MGRVTDIITQQEMIALFGESMPIVAVKLLWEASDETTVGEVREKLREIAAQQKEG